LQSKDIMDNKSKKYGCVKKLSLKTEEQKKKTAVKTCVDGSLDLSVDDLENCFLFGDVT